MKNDKLLPLYLIPPGKFSQIYPLRWTPVLKVMKPEYFNFIC